MIKQGTYIALAAILLAFYSTQVSAQEAPEVESMVVQSTKTPQKAFFRSLILPGWGHQYAQNGSWRGMATVFVGAELGLWFGLINADWRHDHLVQGYQTLAANRAGADIEGKDRTFYLNLATFMSSDEYLDIQLRNRAWDRVDYVSDPSFFWAWDSVDDFQTFREMRDDAESLSRRRSIFIALLVANRLVSAISSIGAVNRAAPDVSLSFGAPPVNERYPMVHLVKRF